jgi:hypothetical protein
MNYDILKDLNKKIPHHTKICFITGVVIGWITHFFMLTNKLPNWDDVNCFSNPGSGDFLGRWFLKYIHKIGTSYSIPAVHGFLMIVILSLAACLVLEILNLKSTTAAVLVPMLMVTFPSVACTMTFMFMSHTSAIAIFMICLAILLLRKYRWGFVPCIVLLICSLGTYQSYISIAITLMLLGMIVDLLEDKDVWKTFKHAILCVVVLLVSAYVYMGLSHLIYPDMANEHYAGVSEMGQIAIADMPKLIGRCYKRFLEFFIWKPFDFMYKIMQVMNICTSILAVVLGIYLIVAKKIYQKIYNFILLCVIAFFVPLAAAFVYFMAPEADYSMLMLYSYVLIYVAVVMLWEKASAMWAIGIEKKTWIYKAVTIAVVTVMCISCYSDYLLTNRAYMRMYLSYERVTSYFNRILTRVEEMDGYQNGDNVMILGEFNYKDNPSPIETVDRLDTESLRSMDGVALEKGLFTLVVINNFIRTYLGFDMMGSTYSQKAEMMNSQEYIDMPIYPSEGSIKKIGDAWVVKLCDNVED